MSVETSILIPTLDDEETLASTVDGLNKALAASGAPAEVLVVDAGSRDGTLEIAADAAQRLPLLHMRLLVQDRERSGFGTAVRLGMAYARGRFCIIVMPDARDPLELIPKMISELRSGAHLVLVSRYESDETSDVPHRFVWYQSMYRRAIRLLLGADIPDSTYGFRGFNRTFAQALGISNRRLAVCSEITFKVLLAGGKTVRLQGAQAGPMVSEQSKFRLGNELGGYASTLSRAALHRAGWRWF